MSVLESRIRDLFEKAVELSGAVGIQLSLIKDDEQLDFCSGFANAELGISMTEDTVVQIGSSTKVLNAILIMTLIEEGRLDLDVPVKTFIPELELSDARAAKSVTLRHLLSMSSGMDNGDYADYGEGQDAIARRVALLKGLPQHFPPGSHFGYSNAGIDVSGYAAERVTGGVWDDLLEERVLNPMRLKNASSRDRDRTFQRVAVGHSRDPTTGEIKVIRPWSAISRGAAPSGSTLTASAHDLARIGQLFIKRGIADGGGRILAQASIQTLMTPQIPVPVHHQATYWCLGPFGSDWDGATVRGHHGGNTSGTSLLYWLPDKQGVVACTFNTPSVSAYERLVKITTQEIMGAAFDVTKPPVKAPALPVEFDPSRCCGVYEAVAGQCSIGPLKGALEMSMKWTLGGGKYDERFRLVPLGGDRFLIDKGPGADPLALPEDMAFFGTDEQGRASNLIRLVFPFSRRN